MQVILGIALIVVGALILSYQGFIVKKGNKTAQIGEIKVTASNKKDIFLSPMVGGIIIAIGVILLIV